MSAETVEIGHGFRVAVKRNPGPWGAPPVLLGAGDGFEFNSESIKSGVSLIQNEGIYGSAYRRPGTPGPRMPGGDFEFDLYYKCASNRLAAAPFSRETVTVLGGGAFRHDLALVGTNRGLHFTLAALGLDAVREWPCAKVTGCKYRWQDSDNGQRGKVTATLACFDTHFNVGAPDDDAIVAPTPAVNGPLPLTAQAAEFNASPLTVTKAAGITALTVTIVAKDRRERAVTRTITQADFTGNTWTGTEHVGAVVSITLSGVTGVGEIRVGVSNGVNNPSTAEAVTTEADRDVTLFSDLEIWIGPQKGPALTAADEQFVSSVEIGVEDNVDKRVTSRFKDRIEEPTKGGGGRPTVTFGFNFSALTTKNRRHFTDVLAKKRLKARVALTGPPIGSSGIPHSMTFWLNELQLEGDFNVGGAGVVPFDVTAEANDAVVVPDGFPAGVIQPVFLQLVNGQATPIL